MVLTGLDLLDSPYTFTQLTLLLPAGFVRAATERGVQMTEKQLEGLHRLRLLVPLFRVRRDVRAITRFHRSNPLLAHQLAHWEPTSRRDLLEAREADQLSRPQDERFMSADRRRRYLEDVPYLASEYLYSQYQLLALPLLESALPHLRYDKAGVVVGLDVNPFWRRFAETRSRQLGELVVPLSLLEPAHYPAIVRQLSLGAREEFEVYDQWRSEISTDSITRQLGVEPAGLKATAEWILHEANGLDPLRSWVPLIREADPDRWFELRGRARSAIDFRIAAELFARCYEEPGDEGTSSTQVREELSSGSFAFRLKPRGYLDRTLTDFGLSPHPSLLLVVEGETELLLFPRVMEMFGIRTDPDNISVESAHSVNRDLTALVAYAIAPRAEMDPSGRFLLSTRPLTRILVIADAEGPMANAAERRRRKNGWVRRLMLTLPKDQRQPSVRQALERLIYLDTWRRNGASFEFAHFTDLEIARAIVSIDDRRNPLSLETRMKQMAGLRAARGNLKKVLGSLSKLDLADEMWPTLERKIRRAEAVGTAHRIPIVRVLDRATELARVPRQGIAIPVRRKRRK